MNPNRYTSPGLPMIGNKDGMYVTYQDYTKLHKMYQSQHELLSNTNDKLHDYQNLLVEMLDYYKIGGYEQGWSYPSVEVFGNMLRDAIEEYIDTELENCNLTDVELLTEVEHLRSYTDHLVVFSKLPCLPKDLDNLRNANISFAEENESLKNEIIGWENKWNAAIQMAAEAENKLEAIRAYISED